MILLIILFSIGIILCLGCLWSKYGEDIDMRRATSIGLLMLATLFRITITLISTPSVEDYVNGRVGTRIVTTVKDGGIIKCDTLYYKK